MSWRLPTVDELRAILEPSLQDEQNAQCGSTRCAVYEGFELSSWWFWSDTEAGIDGGWYVPLMANVKFSIPITRPDDGRALCVRPSRG